ncbi:hypothetical protein SELMODRAFT_404199 [Selaginella moellendorffii]|uniref:Uncharacterized protein n=1 Tax=Selaginella moellendorffii TaxID=88036 RepID=D8QUK6_SELML|nr:hypothetical protein SELMODRAFT_404199 [Selaginella moellendorffii]
MAARSWSSSVASGPVIFQILYALVSNAALRLFIANAYFFQRQQQDPSSDGRQDLSLCSEFQGCSYILSKLDELMAANAATTEWEDQEETLARLTRSASVMAHFTHGKTPQGDLLDLFDVTKISLGLVYCWLLLQLGRKKKSLVWLTRLESQALAGIATAGGHASGHEDITGRSLHSVVWHSGGLFVLGGGQWCALKNFGRKYWRICTRSMMSKGNRTPAIGIHVIPKQARR